MGAQDEAFVVFRDHKPAAAHHLLVVPRRHIDSVRTLGKEDAAMGACAFRSCRAVCGERR